jgi:ornithine cyclodeaminase
MNNTGPHSPSLVPTFGVIGGGQVATVLTGREREVVRLVEDTYRWHGAGDSVNPPSYFLRFPDKPSSRIIALPASIGGDIGVDGIKWISSFPENVAAGIPRASAVLILNDHETGYPFACMESSIISATRTAASAAAGADWLSRGRPRPRRVGFIGLGLIARYIHTYLDATGWEFDTVNVHDLSPESTVGFCKYLSRAGAPRMQVHADPEELIRSSDLLVLHISLRDLSPEIILSSTNIVDDVEHCLKADTSPHLAEKLVGNRDFINGTLADVMAGQVRIPRDRPVVFSPFGLGVLDLAVGKFVHDQVARSGSLHVVDDFFHELRRH